MTRIDHGALRRSGGYPFTDPADVPTPADLAEDQREIDADRARRCEETRRAYEREHSHVDALRDGWGDYDLDQVA